MTEEDIKTEEYVDINHPLYEKRIVMTKVRDSEIIEFVKKMKGELDNNISKKTFVLIVKSLDDDSNKVTKAKKENIPIMTVEMFKDKYMK